LPAPLVVVRPASTTPAFADRLRELMKRSGAVE